MKLKRSSLSSQILILALGGIMLALMMQLAQAQNNNEPLLAQTNAQAQNSTPQILQTDMPQKGLGRRIWEDTSLTYYQQFLGPTVDGDTSRTYNVFQEGIDTPNSGFAPLQSFNAFNLRHQINTDWAIGASVAFSNGYTEEVQNKDRNGNTFTNKPDTEFFNARAYVALPPIKTEPINLYTTLSFEAPTSEISQNNDMRYGWVFAQNATFNLQSLKWSAGLTYQAYRMYYNTNVQPPPFSPALGGKPTPLQTLILSGGPYVNYRFNDRWQLGSVVTLDWDQRGVQSSSREFNNNLPHRGRMSLTYFPQMRFFQSVGIFTQGLLKFRPSTTAMGADFSLRF